MKIIEYKENMNSYDFCEVINSFRVEEGGRRIKHNKLMAKILDECPEIIGGKKSSPNKIIVEAGGKGTGRMQEIEVVILNSEQMLLVGMRESKVVRRRVLSWMKDAEKELQSKEVAEANTLGRNDGIKMLADVIKPKLDDLRNRAKYADRLERENKAFRKLQDPELVKFLIDNDIV